MLERQTDVNNCWSLDDIQELKTMNYILNHLRSEKMENIKANQDLLKDNVIPCCWSEVNKDGKLITNCPNTPTKRDEDNHQIRYFCEEHMKKVEEIRYIMYLKMKEKYELWQPPNFYN
ncbi:MAG: hypothetical protein FCO83_00260 [Spiroplasma sp. WSS]|nr:MAG: hypothetical protein FCO83_00260 [Spiroplasma sp. WSS]